MRILWTEREATFHGRFFNFDAITIDPPPVRLPPVWVGGRAGKALERAGRKGDGWLAYLQSVQGFTKGLATVRQAAHEAGRQPEDITPAVMLPTLVRSDGACARREVADHMTTRYGREFGEESVQRLCLAGTATECAQRLGEYVTAGARHIVFNPAGPPESFAEDAAVIAQQVIPAVSGTRHSTHEKGTA